MNSTEKAIKKAIDGGYQGGKNFASYRSSHGYHRIIICDEGILPKKVLELSDILLDPTFWQALGKAEGWGNISLDGAVWKSGRDGYINVWQSYWHDFIDHLASGKSADAFFEELLKDNQTKQ